MKRSPIAIVLLIFALLLSACGDEPTPTAEPGLELADEISLDLTRDWYVETTGDDANFCTTIDNPCLTIRGALTQSTLGDRIHVGAGTFVEPGMPSAVLAIGHSISIIGTGPGATIVDANNAEGGIFLSPGTAATSVHLEGFTIQNTVSGAASGCIDNRSPSTLTVQNVEMRNCWRSGFSNTGTGLSQLIDVYIHDAIDEDTNPDFTLNGSGVVSSGDLVIEGGEIADNPRYGIDIVGGSLSLTGTSINGNQSYGIFIQDTVETSLNNATITNNALRGVGTGLFITQGRVIVSASDISANTNSGIFQAGGALHVSTTTIHNEPKNALHVAELASAELEEVIIRNNGSSGEFSPTVWNSGSLIIKRSTFTRNHQIALYNAASGAVALFDTQLIDNQAADAAFAMESGTTALLRRVLIATNNTGDSAALEDYGGDFTAYNLTISNNSGLGISSRAPFNVFNSTIAENNGFGALFQSVGGLLADVIIANNDGGDCSSPILDTSFPGLNMDTDASCNFATTYSAAELLLGPLADNGGISETHALDPASPAVDAATGGACPPTDQRRYLRPGSPACDVGAYEISETMVAIEALEFEEPSDELVEIFTPTPEGDASGIAVQNAACRKGADPAFDVLNFLFEGQSALLIGQMTAGTWYYLELPDELGRCWIFAENLDLFGDFAGLPFFTPPELPSNDEGGGDDSSGDEGGGSDGGGNDGGGNDGGGNDGGGGSAPDAPSNVNHQCSGGSFEFIISWIDNADNEDGFRIYVDGNQVGDIGANVEKFTHNPGGTGPYTIIVEAYNANGDASASQGNVGCLP
jgi:uncharacterized membrane protein YgcG